MSMQFRSLFAKAAAALGLVLAAVGTAQARDVHWSVGVGITAPGAVTIGASNHGHPVYVQPAPVYVQPQPVYVQPQPTVVYTQPQVIYTQPRVVYPAGFYYQQPAPVVVIRGGGHGGHGGHHFRGNGHGHGHGHWKSHKGGGHHWR
jgi:hypothetical protein